MKIKPTPTDEIDFGVSFLLDANLHIHHFDEIDFGEVFEASMVRYTQPAIADQRVAYHLVKYYGRDSLLITHPDGSGMLIESAAADELCTHAAFCDARASGLI